MCTQYKGHLRCCFFPQCETLEMQSCAFCCYGGKEDGRASVDPMHRNVLRFWKSKCVHCGRVHTDVILGWCLILCPSAGDRAGLLLFMLLVMSGYCCCWWRSSDVPLLPLVSCLDNCPSCSELASDLSKAFSRSSTEFLSYSSLMCSFSTSTSSRTAYIKWLFTKSWRTKRGEILTDRQ